MTRMPLFVAIFGLMLHGQADICLLKEASKRDQHFNTCFLSLISLCPINNFSSVGVLSKLSKLITSLTSEWVYICIETELNDLNKAAWNNCR